MTEMVKLEMLIPDDVEQPTDITMSRVHLASDTCDIYFTYIKVNHLLYMCSLDPFEDGILLDTLSCARIGIVGTLRTTRRSASAKVQLHHPRGRPGSDDGRRRSC